MSMRLSPLHPGCYNKEAKEIFEFVKELVAQGKRRAGLVLDTLYTCFYRTILFELSRGTDTLVKRTAVLNALNRVRDCKSLVFGPGNCELEFVSCLTHCLPELTSSRHQVSLEKTEIGRAHV